MAAELKENIPILNESKSSKKKKAKAEAAAAAEPSTPSVEDAPDTQVNGADSSNESPYLRELSKNIRNLKKKLTASAKVDAILADNPGKSLDELLNERKINADQKAQVEKKPGLQALLEQNEVQMEQYKKLDEDYQKKMASERELLGKSHDEELEKVRDTVRVEAKEEAEKQLKEKLLSLSRFLRAAAAKRSDGDDTAEENLAFEGALLLIYGGDIPAAQAMEKLIDGSEEIVPTVEGLPSNFSFKHVRDAAEETAPVAQPVAEAVDTNNSATEATPAPIESDPTVANAGLTELDATNEIQVHVNGEIPPAEAPSAPEAGMVDAGAANAVAEASWDNKMSQSMTSGGEDFEIVEHPRDPKETDTGLEATPAAAANTQSWAEDVPTETTAPVPAPAASNDGFHEVHHNRGRGRGGHQGEWRGGRGRGRGDGYRGRGGGYRGDRGGRGRGGPRGGRARGDSSQ